MYSISPELYYQYKDLVLAYSLANQRYRGTKVDRTSSCLTDKEIAERLGLEEKDVTEIRCVAEVDTTPLEAYAEAESFKNERCRSFLGK